MRLGEFILALWKAWITPPTAPMCGLCGLRWSSFR